MRRYAALRQHIACALRGIAGAAALLPLATGAAADENLVRSLAAAWPTGSVHTEAAARAATDAADAVQREADERYERERHDCMSRFFVNHCQDSSRLRHLAVGQEALRVRVEADDWLRHDDAQRRRQQALDRPAPTPPQKPAPPPDGPRDPLLPRREPSAAQPERAPLLGQGVTASAARAPTPLLPAPADAAARQAAAQQNARKQQDAAEHARQVAEDQKKNAERRAQRSAERAEQERRRLDPNAVDN